MLTQLMFSCSLHASREAREAREREPGCDCEIWGNGLISAFEILTSGTFVNRATMNVSDSEIVFLRGSSCLHLRFS